MIGKHTIRKKTLYLIITKIMDDLVKVKNSRVLDKTISFKSAR